MVGPPRAARVRDRQRRLQGERFATVDPEGRSAFVLAEDFKTITGFVVSDYNEGEPLDLDDPHYWDGPRFEVPALGLLDASAGEVVLAVRARYGDDHPTADAAHFHAAMDAEDPAEAVALLSAITVSSHELGDKFFYRRDTENTERYRRRLIHQLERFGHQVTLEPIPEAA